MGCNTSQEKTAPQVSDDTNEQQQQELTANNDTNNTIKSEQHVAESSAADSTVQDNSHNAATEIKTKSTPTSAVECNGNGGIHLAAPEALEEEEESLNETPLLNGENGEPMGKDEGEFCGKKFEYIT